MPDQAGCFSHRIISYRPTNRSTDSTLKLWDVNTAESVRTFSGHVNETNFVGLTAHGDYITCGSENSSVYTYFKALPKPVMTFKFHAANPATVRQRRRRRALAVACADQARQSVRARWTNAGRGH